MAVIGNEVITYMVGSCVKFCRSIFSQAGWVPDGIGEILRGTPAKHTHTFKICLHYKSIVLGSMKSVFSWKKVDYSGIRKAIFLILPKHWEFCYGIHSINIYLYLYINKYLLNANHKVGTVLGRHPAFLIWKDVEPTSALPSKIKCGNSYNRDM